MALAGRGTTAHVAGELLSAYFDGELPVEDRRRVEAHLRDCAACRAALRAYHGVSALLSTLGTPPVPEQLGHDLRRRPPRPSRTGARLLPRRSLGGRTGAVPAVARVHQGAPRSGGRWIAWLSAPPGRHAVLGGLRPWWHRLRPQPGLEPPLDEHLDDRADRAPDCGARDRHHDGRGELVEPTHGTRSAVVGAWLLTGTNSKHSFLVCRCAFSGRSSCARKRNGSWPPPKG